MRIIGVQKSRVSPFLIAVVLLLQLSPALATGQPDAQQATIQGSRFPGMPVPSTETTRDKRRGPVEVTFTKWRDRQVTAPAGRRDAVTLCRHRRRRSRRRRFCRGGSRSQNEHRLHALRAAVNTGHHTSHHHRINNSLHAIYEVQVGEHSFIALIQGGSNQRGRPARGCHRFRVADRLARACGIR